MSKWILILLGALIVGAIGVITFVQGLLPPFVIPFVVAIYVISIVYALKKG